MTTLLTKIQLPSIPHAEIEISLEAKQFIIAVREMAKKDLEVLPVPREKVLRLMMLMKERILIPDSRKKVLSAILGIHVESTNRLSVYVTNVLIREIEKRQNATRILREIEKVIVNEPGIRADALFSWDWNGYEMPDMSGANTAPPSNGFARSPYYPGAGTEVEQS